MKISAFLLVILIVFSICLPQKVSAEAKFIANIAGDAVSAASASSTTTTGSTESIHAADVAAVADALSAASASSTTTTDSAASVHGASILAAIDSAANSAISGRNLAQTPGITSTEDGLTTGPTTGQTVEIEHV